MTKNRMHRKEKYVLEFGNIFIKQFHYTHPSLVVMWYIAILHICIYLWYLDWKCLIETFSVRLILVLWRLAGMWHSWDSDSSPIYLEMGKYTKRNTVSSNTQNIQNSTNLHSDLPCSTSNWRYSWFCPSWLSSAQSMPTCRAYLYIGVKSPLSLSTGTSINTTTTSTIILHSNHLLD